MIKTYQLNQRKNTSSIVLQRRKVSVRFDFKGGSVITNTPAMFSTANAFYQEVIEESELFRKGIIKLARPAKTDSDGIKEVKNVKTLEQAVDYIAKNFHAQVKTIKEAKAFAERQNIVFPNLSTPNPKP